MAKRRFRRQTRETATRDAKKLIIIATEGSKTEPQYFNSLKAQYRLSNVKVLTRKSTRSSPKDVIKCLDKYKRDNGFSKGDKFWAVFDRDNWPTETLDKVASQAKDKKYCLADSNPCFELWLLLHHKRLNELKGLEGRAAIGGCDSVKEELRKVDRNYDKSQYNTEKYIEKIDQAIANAKETDIQSKKTPLLNQISTRVYLLAQSVIDSSSPQPLDN